MYILTKEAFNTLRAIATLVVISLVLWTLGVFPFQLNADAANLISLSDTLSDSAPLVGSNQTIQFTIPNGAMTGQTITVSEPSFTIGSIDFSDIDVTVGGNNITLGSAAAGTTWGVSTSTSLITFTTSSSSGATVASSSVVIIKIGSNASFQSTGVRKITNPVVGSYEFTIAGTIPDTGQTRVAIVNNVLVTANVDTTLTFVISGVAIGATVNSSATTTSTTTTATTLAFGTLAPNVSKTLAQDLAVTTNAANGFVVTVQQSQNLLSSTGADIDGFKDGAYTNTPTAWTTPVNTITNEATWGHWGLTSDDDINASEFATDKWVAASTTARQIFSYTGPSDGVTQNKGKARVGYQAQITSLQEAADDYNTTLTYIATPTF